MLLPGSLSVSLFLGNCWFDKLLYSESLANTTSWLIQIFLLTQCGPCLPFVYNVYELKLVCHSFIMFMN